MSKQFRTGRSKTVLVHREPNTPVSSSASSKETVDDNVFYSWKRTNKRYYTTTYLQNTTTPTIKINCIEDYINLVKHNKSSLLPTSNPTSNSNSNSPQLNLKIKENIMPIAQQNLTKTVEKQPILPQTTTTSIHKSLKDIINQNYKLFYHIDATKVHYKVGLSKRRLSSLPSLHPRTRKNP